MMEAKVIQKPGAVLVVMPVPNLSISCLTSTKKAMSMANAIRVNNAAKNENKEAKSVRVIWVESESRNAVAVTTVATG